MLSFTSEVIEFRGYQEVHSKKGNKYYLLNCENLKTGEAYQFYISDVGMLMPYQKGDKIQIEAFYDFKYKQLRVTDVMPE